MSDDIMRLNSIDLREAADYASSTRAPGGHPLFLVVSSRPDPIGELTIRHVAADPPATGPDDVVIPCNTSTVTPGRPRVTAVTIQAQGMEEPETLNGYDAVFWSEAAVEKFLFPYYASKYQWKAAHVLSVLSQVFYGFVPGREAEAPDGDAVPFAMAHLPRSEYVPLDEGGDLVVLLRDREGRVSHRSFAEFLKEA